MANPKPKQLTSVMSYPERGQGGNNKYRGNCAPQVIEDLIRFYKPEQICDYMIGGGTTFDAAANCGIPCHGYDLNRGFDLMSMEIPERSQFTFWHPPYWDIVLYSDVMYKASDIEKQYGFDPKAADLSRIPRWEDFVMAMNYAMMKQFTALEKGGRMAVLMGDIKKRGKLYSMLAEIAKPGTLEQIIIKTQHNCWSDRQVYSGHFIPIQHEYIMVVKKDDNLIFPVMIPRTVKTDIRDLHCATWRDVVAAVMATNPHAAWDLHTLYKEVAGHRKAKSNVHWQEKIRQTLQRYPAVFARAGSGAWRLVAA